MGQRNAGYIMSGLPTSESDSRMMVFAGNANPKLAQAVASQLRLSLGNAIISSFSRSVSL